MKKETILRILTTLSKLGFFICLALVFFNTGIFYERYHSEDQSFLDFFTKKYTHQWDRHAQPSQELKDQIAFYNGIIKKIWGALAFLWLYFVWDYFLDPENHFITAIKRGVEHRRQICKPPQ